MPLAAAAELSNALFQAVVTAGLSVFALMMHRKIRERWVLWWAAAWGLYVLRLSAMIAFLITGNLVWFYWHQVTTGWTALAILWSAITFSGRIRWRPWYLLVALFPPVWAWVASNSLDRFMMAAGPTVVFLAGATIWTAWVFWRHASRTRSGGARFVAMSLFLWGLHHLDYLFLRPQGSGLTWSYYLDILFELSVGIGFGLMALSEFASRLEGRTAELARLSGLMVRQHEAERRRLSRDLHDETAQTLSAVKLEVGMLREGADAMVQDRLDHVLALLDDLGLAPAIHSLAADVGERSRIRVETDLPETTPRVAADVELALFRAAQEALANVVRHAEATTVKIRLRATADRLWLTVSDDGRGLATGAPVAGYDHGHLGLAGMRERIGALGGRVDIRGGEQGGVIVTIEVPAGHSDS